MMLKSNSGSMLSGTVLQSEGADQNMNACTYQLQSEEDEDARSMKDSVVSLGANVTSDMILQC